MLEFHGEEYSEDPDEVDPQHLAPNDAMIYHQIITSCDPSIPTMADLITVTATYETPLTREERRETIEATLGSLLLSDSPELVEGTAIVEYARALSDVQGLHGEAAASRLSEALELVRDAIERVGDDEDLLEIEALLDAYRATM